VAGPATTAGSALSGTGSGYVDVRDSRLHAGDSTGDTVTVLNQRAVINIVNSVLTGGTSTSLAAASAVLRAQGGILVVVHDVLVAGDGHSVGTFGVMLEGGSVSVVNSIVAVTAPDTIFLWEAHAEADLRAFDHNAFVVPPAVAASTTLMSDFDDSAYATGIAAMEVFFTGQLAGIEPGSWYTQSGDNTLTNQTLAQVFVDPDGPDPDSPLDEDWHLLLSAGDPQGIAYGARLSDTGGDGLDDCGLIGMPWGCGGDLTKDGDDLDRTLNLPLANPGISKGAFERD
jgi:hypothetical protein